MSSMFGLHHSMFDLDHSTVNPHHLDLHYDARLEDILEPIKELFLGKYDEEILCQTFSYLIRNRLEIGDQYMWVVLGFMIMEKPAFALRLLHIIDGVFRTELQHSHTWRVFLECSPPLALGLLSITDLPTDITEALRDLKRPPPVVLAPFKCLNNESRVEYFSASALRRLFEEDCGNLMKLELHADTIETDDRHLHMYMYDQTRRDPVMDVETALRYPLWKLGVREEISSCEAVMKEHVGSMKKLEELSLKTRFLPQLYPGLVGYHLPVCETIGVMACDIVLKHLHLAPNIKRVVLWNISGDFLTRNNMMEVYPVLRRLKHLTFWMQETWDTVDCDDSLSSNGDNVLGLLQATNFESLDLRGTAEAKLDMRTITLLQPNQCC